MNPEWYRSDFDTRKWGAVTDTYNVGVALEPVSAQWPDELEEHEKQPRLP